MQVALPENRLRQLIAASGIKATHVASHCDVDQSTLYRWGIGQTAIPDPQKFRLAAFFGVSVPHLMGWDDDQEAA